MTTEAVRDYLSARLPLDLNAEQHFRLLRAVFILVFASTLVIHVLTEQDDTLLDVFIHAITIGLVYTVGVGLATVLFYALRNTRQHVQVWHMWATSLAGFVLGYYVLPLNDLMVWLLGVEKGDHLGRMAFLRLLPVWLLVTYLLVQPYLNESLRSELARLRDINVLLKERDSTFERVSCPIHFESGRTEFTLDADTIRNVAVDDHYCYVHYQRNGEHAKRDVAMPLRDVLALLPSDFVQVHRSHIVNLQHIASIERKSRRVHVVLSGGIEVPVSRHRLDEVLPLLRRRIAPVSSTGTPNPELGK